MRIPTNPGVDSDVKASSDSEAKHPGDGAQRRWVLIISEVDSFGQTGTCFPPGELYIGFVLKQGAGTLP